MHRYVYLSDPDPSDYPSFYDDGSRDFEPEEDADEGAGEELKFEVLDDLDISGTQHMLSDLNVRYSRLVEVFGEPGEGGDGASCEWHIRFEDGVIATIYDWHSGLSETALRDQDFSEWTVGGLEYRAVEHVRRVLQP